MNEDSLKMKNDQDDLKDEDNLKTEKGRLLQKLIQPQKLRGPRKKQKQDLDIFQNQTYQID